MEKRTFYFLVFLTIFLISVVLYFPPFVQQKFVYTGTNFSIDLNQFNEKFQEPSFANFLRKISSPFDFKYFEVYVKPVEKKELNNCPGIDMETVFQEWGDQTHTLSVGKRNLIGNLKIKNYDIGSANATYNFDAVQSPETIHYCSIIVDFETKVFIRMNFWDSLGNALIFFIFYCGVFFLLCQIYEKLKNKKNLESS